MTWRSARKAGRVHLVAATLLWALGVAVTAGATGAWVDAIVLFEEPSRAKAVEMLGAAEMDIYMDSISARDSELLSQIERTPSLAYMEWYGTSYAIDFNPCGPVFPGTCKLNPFAVPRIREAVNWLIDRELVVQEAWMGFAVPQCFAISPLFPEYARLADLAHELEGEYGHDFSRAQAVIHEEMGLLGAELVDGKWYWPGCCDGEPVELTLLIPTWMGPGDVRQASGDYLAGLLEAMGFLVDPHYLASSAARSEIWMQSDPCQGLWHANVSSWVRTPEVPREERSSFAQFYTPLVWPYAPWTAYRSLPGLAAAASRLHARDYRTLPERQELMATALRLSMKDSITVWLAEEAGVWPHRAEVSVVAGLAAPILGSWVWPHTLRFADAVGGTVRIGVPGPLLFEPWNPLDGSSSAYDITILRATGDDGTLPNPITGVHMPHRIESGAVTLETGLAAQVTLDWVTLDFQDVIEVPADAWVDWDSASQTFITVGQKYPDGLTAKRRSVAVYPPDFFTAVMWHDRSPISVADVVLGMILAFDRGMEGGALYDPGEVTLYESFIRHFRGFRIASMNPLTIEYYSDEYTLDAENMVTSLFPYYAYGTAAWHTLALGILAEIQGEAAFSRAKAGELGVPWLSYISGPSLDILAENLLEAATTAYIPYAPTLGQYVTPAEAIERWVNLSHWHGAVGHFWVGTGPFYLKEVNVANKAVRLARFEDYADPSEKWVWLLVP